MTIIPSTSRLNNITCTDAELEIMCMALASFKGPCPEPYSLGQIKWQDDSLRVAHEMCKRIQENLRLLHTSGV